MIKIGAISEKVHDKIQLNTFDILLYTTGKSTLGIKIFDQANLTS